jgi:hypothetical protein
MERNSEKKISEVHAGKCFKYRDELKENSSRLVWESCSDVFVSSKPGISLLLAELVVEDPLGCLFHSILLKNAPIMRNGLFNLGSVRITKLRL